MKFKELESRVATLSLGTENNYRVEHYAGQTVIVNSFALYQINENTVGSFREANDVVIIPERDRLALQKLAYKYSRTPLDERRDEPKFRVRMLPGENGFDTYLNKDRSNKDIFLSEREEDDDNQTIFTKSEYDKLQQKYPEWLPEFDEKDPHFEFLEEK
ncbi:hypothetical protein AB3X83_03250 (plasmid) [Lentilactobacillus buchneri]|uniref:hypothetical protein n=1 Tax=Lentilactobacillus buchneri TaxID=1581 RepID=UPI0034E3A8ED